MFRRIELIDEGSYLKGYGFTFPPRKSGLWVSTPCGDFSFRGLKAPNKRIGRNCRFYFTERGWHEVGRHIVGDLKAVRQKYRVITIKERSVDIVFQDDLQVAVRPRKRPFKASSAPGDLRY